METKEVLITEEDRRKIYDIAKSISQDEDILTKFPDGIDENKVAYLIETIIKNDMQITAESIMEVAEALFDTPSSSLN